jgi:hypothetical protein
MFSEDNILNYCDLCKKCEEVEKCPVKAGVYRRQASSSLIPGSAIRKMAAHNCTLFNHIGGCNFHSDEMWGDLDKLKKHVFKIKRDS